MDFIKQLLCKIFGHKYKKYPSNEPGVEVWRCKRCGDERRIETRIRRRY